MFGEKKQIDHKANGYDVVCTHSGQRQRYGDTFREFTVKSDKPADEVKKYCTEFVHECSITTEDWLINERSGSGTMDEHFRSNYTFHKVADGEYFYKVTSPSTC